MNATATKNANVKKIQKSIELQNRIRANIESSRISLSNVDGMDVDHMLSQCDIIITMLENRISQIERRSN